MTTKKDVDVAVIGAGPGGYVAAIKLAQEGRKVALIEKSGLGGTCLHVGCIPTKTLLANALILHQVKRAGQYGISVGSITFDYAIMKERKDQVVAKIAKSLRGLIEANRIEIIQGTAEFLSPYELKVTGEGACTLKAAHIIIATGSEPLDIPAFACDHERILNSTSLLKQTTLPKHLVIVGGGYIGCEFASLYRELGVQVTIVEALPTILSLQGKAIAAAMTAAFTKQGIELKTNALVETITHQKGGGIRVNLKGADPIDADCALVAVGRRIDTSALRLDRAGIATLKNGAIDVNLQMETQVPGIYAIGDVTGKYLLAHVASHQGLVAASSIIGKKVQMHYNAVPSVIFTHPEIASVGMTLEQAEQAGFAAVSGKFPFQALGKSIASLDTEGYAEVIIDKQTGQILGAHVVGHEAATLIGEMALAMHNELTVESIFDTIHAHPTLAESWMEAALLANDTPIHMPPRKK